MSDEDQQLIEIVGKSHSYVIQYDKDGGKWISEDEYNSLRSAYRKSCGRWQKVISETGQQVSDLKAENERLSGKLKGTLKLLKAHQPVEQDSGNGIRGNW